MDTIEISIDHDTHNRLTKLSKELNLSELSVVQLAVKALAQESFMEQIISDFELLRANKTEWDAYIQDVENLG
jgi:hypothetical protein